MKILFVSTRFPYPPHQGDRLKIYNTIKRLSKTHEIYLLTFIEDNIEREYIKEMEKYCVSIDVVHMPKIKSVLNCFNSIFRKEPFQVAYYKNRSMQDKIDNLINNVKFDIIHVHLIRSAQYFEKHKDIKKVLDLTDAVSLYMKRVYENQTNLLKKLLYFVEWKKISRYEKIAESYDKVLLCSKEDIKALESNNVTTNFGVTNNGVDTNYFEYKVINYYKNRLVFTGNLSYYPNIDGILFFYNTIFPLIIARKPDTTLYIVGKNPPNEILELKKDKRVVVTGFVEDIRQYYTESAVSISPIRIGAGTLNKILEPMALGVPVVSTSLGGEGFSVENGRNIMIADNPEDFAQSVIKLMDDTSLRNKIAEEARKYIEEHHNWDSIVEKLNSYYQEMLETKES